MSQMEATIKSSIIKSLSTAKSKTEQERLRAFWWGKVTAMLDLAKLTVEEYAHLRDVALYTTVTSADGKQHKPPRSLL